MGGRVFEATNAEFTASGKRVRIVRSEATGSAVLDTFAAKSIRTGAEPVLIIYYQKDTMPLLCN